MWRSQEYGNDWSCIGAGAASEYPGEVLSAFSPVPPALAARLADIASGLGTLAGTPDPPVYCVGGRRAWRPSAAGWVEVEY